MSEPGDVEARLAAVERAVRSLREDVEDARRHAVSADRRAAVSLDDAAASRVLASGAHEDVADVKAKLDAHTRSLNALRETQVEDGREMREGLAEMRQGFATLSAGMAQITALLERLASPEQDEE